MITDYFVDLRLIEKTETADDLGGFVTKYIYKGTFKGLLQRASTAERTIASQLGISEVYTLMSTTANIGKLNIDKGMIIESEGDGKFALIDSFSLKGQGDLSNIIQWTCKSYELPSDAVVEGI
jgi:hypothetical protein